ncbi:MAG: hypothetical protein K6T80_03405 [Firmicutes bacterium]|nr:hypothetical protein [Bacillota bacterium]
MTKLQNGDGAAGRECIRVRIRLDFKGTGKPGRFIFGGKSTDRAAEEAREHQVSIFRNVPIQGIHIEDIDAGSDVYTVVDEMSRTEVSYAPLILTLSADSLESVIKFIAREDFRKIEMLYPETIALDRFDIERLMFGIHREMNEHRSWLERKYNLR